MKLHLFSLLYVNIIIYFIYSKTWCIETILNSIFMKYGLSYVILQGLVRCVFSMLNDAAWLDLLPTGLNLFIVKFQWFTDIFLMIWMNFRNITEVSPWYYLNSWKFISDLKVLQREKNVRKLESKSIRQSDIDIRIRITLI